MRKKFFEDRMGLIKRAGAVALAAIIAGTGFVAWQNGGSGSYSGEDIPELVSFTDPEDITEVEEDSVPLASSPKVTKKVTTKNTTKKVKMKKKAKKSGTTTKKDTKKNSKTKTSSNNKVKTDTTVVTTTKTTTKKNSKIKTVKTKVVTTVKTTTTALKASSDTTAEAVAFSYDESDSGSTATGTSTGTSTASIRTLASKANANVLNAFEKMYGKVVINGGVSYSGCFDANTMTITLKESGSTVYHELGHFVDFVGGTGVVDQQISTAYSEEKSKYTAYNKSYVLQNSSEYFAESFKNYCEDPASLKSSRPKTYAAIVAALNNMTDTRINTLLSVYGSIWNK